MKTQARRIRLSARDSIVEAAVALYSQNPKASLEEVAAMAGVSRATLFRQFANRDDLVRAAGMHSLAELEKLLSASDKPRGNARTRLLRLLEVLVPSGQKLRFVFASGDMLGDAALKKASERLDRHIAPVIAAAVRAGLLTEDVKNAWFAEAFDALLFACWTAVAAGTIARADAPALLMRTLLHGFGKQHPE